MSRNWSLVVDAPEGVVLARLERGAAEDLVIKRGSNSFGPWLARSNVDQSRLRFRVGRARAGILRRSGAPVLMLTVKVENGHTRLTGRFHSRLHPVVVMTVAALMAVLDALAGPGLIAAARDRAGPLVDWGMLNPSTNTDAVVVMAVFVGLMGVGWRALEKIEEAWLSKATRKLLQPSSG